MSRKQHFLQWLDNLLNDEGERFSRTFRQTAAGFLAADEKTQANVLKDFHSRMNLLSDPLVREATSSNDFDFRLLRQQKMSIYINIPVADRERLRPLLTLFWTQLINHLSVRLPDLYEEPYGVLALLDEFGNMAKIPPLKDGMSYLRAYRIRCIVIVQYLGQILSVYGQHDSKGFLNAKIKMTFASNDINDAEFFSKSLGNKTIRVVSRGVSHNANGGSHSSNASYRAKPLLTVDQLMGLSRDRVVICLESKPPVNIGKYFMLK